MRSREGPLATQAHARTHLLPLKLGLQDVWQGPRITRKGHARAGSTNRSQQTGVTDGRALHNVRQAMAHAHTRTLVTNELLLHQQEVMHSLQLQEAQSTLGRRHH